MGTLGDFSSSLTSSTDVTHYTASVTDNRAIDFGHGDIFIANDASELVWEKMYDWLVIH